MYIEKFLKDKPLESLNVTISKILRECNVYADTQGYQYLQTAITTAVLNQNVVHNIVKDVYSKIAKTKGVTSASVERCIRHAIERAWKFQEIIPSEILEELFLYSKRVGKYKPTNTEFIATIAEQIRIH